MNKVRIVSKYPDTKDPNIIYYNRTLREISVNTGKGHVKFQSIFIPKDIDAFSINGWYPLYETSSLAQSNSPSNAFISLGQNELGSAPIGITYPVFMPVGVVPAYQGNYIDPAGDEDGDGILNFRDPDIIGSSEEPIPDLPSASAISVQWFEENAQGDLVPRDSSFDSVNPAVQYWENVGSDSISPRTTPYSSDTESAQFFDEDSSGNISPL